MDPTRLRAQVRAQARRRDAVLEELLAIRGTLAGSLFRRWRVCGKPGCRCTRGEPHGPYLCLSLFEAGKPRVFAVAPDKTALARAGARAYRRWLARRRQLRKLDATLHAVLQRLRHAEQLDSAEVTAKRP